MLSLLLSFFLSLAVFTCGGAILFAVHYFMHTTSLYVAPFFYTLSVVSLLAGAFNAGFLRGAAGFKVGFCFGLLWFVILCILLVWFAPVLLDSSLLLKSFGVLEGGGIVAAVLGANVAAIAASEQKKE